MHAYTVILEHNSVLYIIVRKYSSADKQQTTMFEKMRSWKTPAELQSDKSFHIGLPIGQNAQPFTLKLVFLRSSIDATAFESDRVTIATTRRKWRPPSVQSDGLAKDGLQTITTPLFQVRFSPTWHLRLDKRMIFPMMLLNKQCNEIFQRYGCSKKFPQSTALHSYDHDSADSTNERRRSPVVSTSQMAGVARSYMEVIWCKFMQARASFEVASQRQVEQRRGGKAERRKLVIIYHASDIICSLHCQIIDCYDLNE